MQHWYWYPCLNFLALSLTPTALVGVNENLKLPKSFEFVSNNKPSLFKYPDFLKKDENKGGGKVETAVLSTTVKVKARNTRKQKAEGGDAMQIDGGAGNEESKDLTEEEQKKKDEEKKEEEKKEEEKAKLDEPEPET